MEEPTQAHTPTLSHREASHVVRTLILIFLVFFSFRSFSHNYSYLGYDWVGWRNDSLGWAGKPVEMVFEFDTVRNFSAMVLHTNNMFSKDVQVSLFPSIQRSGRKRFKAVVVVVTRFYCGGVAGVNWTNAYKSTGVVHTYTWRGTRKSTTFVPCAAPGGLHKGRHGHCS